MPMIGASIYGKRPCGVSIDSGPRNTVSTFARKRAWPATCSQASTTLTGRVPSLCALDSWYASNRLLQWCRRQGWHIICAIKSNGKLGDKKLTTSPPSARHQRYQRVLLTATDGRQRPYLVRTLQGKLNKLSFEVCVLISKRHHREKRPKYFLCTDLALSAREMLPIYQKRWPIEVDNFYVKQQLGLADFRVQSYEATEKWFAIVFVALAFLQWRLNHAPPEARLRSLQMWCINSAMDIATYSKRPVKRQQN